MANRCKTCHADTEDADTYCRGCGTHLSTGTPWKVIVLVLAASLVVVLVLAAYSQSMVKH